MCFAATRACTDVHAAISSVEGVICVYKAMEQTKRARASLALAEVRVGAVLVRQLVALPCLICQRTLAKAASAESLMAECITFG